MFKRLTELELDFHTRIFMCRIVKNVSDYSVHKHPSMKRSVSFLKIFILYKINIIQI